MEKSKNEKSEQENNLLRSLGNKAAEADEIETAASLDEVAPEAEGTDNPEELSGLEALKKNWKSDV